MRYKSYALFHIILGFCIIVSTCFDPQQAYAQGIYDDGETMWRYPYQPYQYYYTSDFSCTFSRNFWTIFIACGLGTLGGMIAGNVAGKRASDGDDGKNGKPGKRGEKGKHDQRSRSGPRGPTGAGTIENGTATLTFTFTSDAVVPGVNGTWQGFVVQPGQTVDLVGSFDLSLAPQTHLIQFPTRSGNIHNRLFSGYSHFRCRIDTWRLRRLK